MRRRRGQGPWRLDWSAVAFRVAEDACFLFGVSPSDPAVYATVSGVLIVVALLACWIPAHRATRVDPIAILRGE